MIKLPTLTELNEKYSYDAESGELRYKKHRSASKVGTLVGHEQKTRTKSYLRARLGDNLVLVHRICWKMGTGTEPLDQVDHINGNGLDNRLCNLRVVTNKENSYNRIDNRSSTGFRGVRKAPHSDRFVARITVDGKATHIGTFDCFNEAKAARLAAERHAGFTRGSI